MPHSRISWVEGLHDRGNVPPALFTVTTLTKSFEEVLGTEAPSHLNMWGKLVGEDWLQSIQEHPAWMAGPATGRLVDLLGVLVEALNRFQGNEHFLWKQINKNLFRVVHERDVSAELPRHSHPCHFWHGVYHSALRWGGLEHDWLVDEVECGYVSGRQAVSLRSFAQSPLAELPSLVYGTRFSPGRRSKVGSGNAIGSPEWTVHGRCTAGRYASPLTDGPKGPPARGQMAIGCP